MVKIEAVVPAYNEGNRIGDVIRGTKHHVDRIIVVDDGRTDSTLEVSKKFGADVIAHKQNRGYLVALKTGFRALKGGIVVTIDADGENDPEDIPKLVKPLVKEKADLVLGKRKRVPRLSERFLDFLTALSFPSSRDLESSPFWQEDKSKKYVVINVPFTYPAREINGVLISGFVALDFEKAVYPSSYLKNFGVWIIELMSMQRRAISQSCCC